MTKSLTASMSKTTRLLIPLAAVLLSCGTAALANGNVSIMDQAGVLSANDKQSITQSAQRAPFGVVVWTVNGGFANNKPGFLNALHGYIGSNTVGIGLDTADRFAEVSARQNTGLSPNDTQAAKASADQHFGSQDWAGGIEAAVGSLASAAPARSSYGGYAQGSYAPRPVYNSGQVYTPPYNSYNRGYQSSGGIGFGSIFLLFVFIGIISMIARRLMGGNRGYYGPGGYGPRGYGGYGPGGTQMYPPGYGYGGGYNQGGNGLLAGGLGALGGGVLGYELGKNAGERENGGQFIQQGGQDWGNAGNAADPGGFVDSDSGAGNAPDFGGGGADFGGGGADFGGGGGGGTDF